MRSGLLMALVGLSLSSFARAQEPAAPPTREEILATLARGEDARDLLRAYAAARTGAPERPTKRRSQEASELEIALEDFLQGARALTDASPDGLRGLLDSLDAVRASDLMARERFRTVVSELETSGVSSDILFRATESERIYLETARELMEILEPPFAAIRDSESPDRESLESAFQAVQPAVALLESRVRREPLTLLRAGVFPYRSARLAGRPVRVEPAVVPSYANPADVPPAAEDLAGTPEAPLDEAILQKAEELGYDYVQIFEFVRNGIATEWYAGGMKGAVKTLRDGKGNDVDQASLLIALLRASQAPARYVHGVVERPVTELAEEWGIPAAQVPTALSRAGIPHEPVIRGGRVSAVKLEHTWVSAYVPYTNYRGAVVDFSGKGWVPLAPAIEKYSRAAATGILKKMGFSAASFLEDALSVSHPTEPLARIRQVVVDYLAENAPDETYEQQLGSRTVVEERIGLLPASLPVTVVAVVGESAALAPDYQHRVRIRVRASEEEDAPVILDYGASLQDLLGERVTLAYQPASLDDHKTVNLFGGLDSVPLYLIRLRPLVRVRGLAEATGLEAVDPGARHRVEVEVEGPFGTEVVSQTVVAGAYSAFAFTAQAGAREPDAGGRPGDSEFLAARLLSGLALDYSVRWGQAEEELAGLLDAAVVRPIPSVAIVSTAVEVHRLFDLPADLRFEGVNLDAALRVAEPLARGDTSSASDWMKLAALQGSALEHALFEEQLLVESISADRGLALARESGAEVLRIDTANVATALGRLQHLPEVVADVANWVRLGAVVEIPLLPVALNAWQGSVWRAEDPATGAGAYLIAGGLAGGTTTIPPPNWVLDFLADALNAPNTPVPNNDPLAGVSITKLGATDGQSGEVGKLLPTELGVLVRDKFGNPVQGAEVTLLANRGGGKLIDPESGAEGESVTVLTNEVGIATASFRLGTSTSEDPIYVLERPDDEHVTQALLHEIEAVAKSENGLLVLDAPFNAIATPGPPRELVRTNSGPTAGVAATWTDSIFVSARDEFQNPVSNVLVTFRSEAPSVLPCDPPASGFQNAVVFDNSADDTGRLRFCPVPQPVLGECGGPSLSRRTSVFGTSAGVILGSSSAAIYRVSADASGLGPVSASYTAGSCNLPWRVDIMSSFSASEFGSIVNAARIGEQFKQPIEVTLRFWDPDYEIRTSPSGDPYVWYFSTGKFKPVEGDVSFSVDNGGSAAGAVAMGSGRYLTRVTTGPAPGFNSVTAHAANVVVTVPTSSGPQDVTLNLAKVVSAVWGLDPKVKQMQPPSLTLGPTGRTATTAIVSTEILPPAYLARSAEADLLREGEWVDFAIASRFGQGTVRIPRGYPFTIDKTYELQYTLNRGSTSEVKSEKFPVPLAQKIFIGFSPFVHVSQDVDALNQRACPLGSEFEFTTTQSARVTLVFKKIGSLDIAGKPNFSSETKIIDDEEFPKGSHRRLITVFDLLPGEYEFELRGVSNVDGHQDIERGGGRSELRVRDSLPVGHAIVKGVDLFDGHLVVMREDFSIGARGVPLDFRRTYSSNAGKELGPLGIGWSHNWDSRVVITPCGEVIVTGGEGSGMRFVDDGSGGLRPLKGYHGSLVANRDDGSFDFFSKGGVRYHYRLFGAAQFRLDFISDPNGNTVDLNYDMSAGRPRLTSVTDSAGRVLGFKWENRIFFNSSGDVLVSVTGPDGISMSFDYDFYGNLVRASREEGPGGPVREETYAHAIGPSFSLEERHLLTKVVNALNGATTEYQYAKAAIGVGPGLQVPSDYVSRMREPEGGETSFQVDVAGLESRGPPEMTSVVIDPLGERTTYTLNQYGSPLRIVDPEGNATSMTWSATDVVMESRTDGNGVTTTFRHDEHGNPIEESVTVQDFDGQTHSHSVETLYWPPAGFAPPHIKDRARSRKDRNGNITEYVYDSRGNLVEERVSVQSVDGSSSLVATRHVYDSRGDRRSTTDPRGFTTSFQYDAFGNLSVTKDALGGQKRTDWTVRSLPRVQTDALGRATLFEHDRLGRLTTTTHPIVEGVAAVERVAYDDRLNSKLVTDTENRSTRTSYDRMGRVVRLENAAGGVMEMTYDLAGNLTLRSSWFSSSTPRVDTTFEYDGTGRLVRTTEPLGKVTVLEYDGGRNVIRETLTDSTTPGFAPRVKEYDYDELNRRIRVRRDLGPRRLEERIRYDGNGNKIHESDPLGREIFYRYDALNRLIETSEPEWKPNRRKITQALYDGSGNRVEERRLNDPAPQIRRFRYDELNRLTEQQNGAGFVTYFFYDPVGNVIREVDARLAVRLHTYDARNRRTSTTTRLDRVTIPSREVVTRFRYDRVGNTVEELQANGNLIRRTYDALNRLTGATDSLGSLGSYEYDARSNRILAIDAAGNETRSFYDALNRLIREEQPESRTRQFTYDVASNRTSETDPRGFTTEMEYDRLDRLVRTTDPAPFRFTVERVYDDAGNVLEEKDRRGNRTRFVYDDLNRVRTIIDPDPLGYVQEFTYDAIGNRILERDRRGILTENHYDGENKLISVTRTGLVLRTIEYDQNGNRRFETDARLTRTGFEYDERNLLIAENRVLAAITRYKLDDMGDRIEERDPEGRVTTRTFDARRRVLSETNGAGETTEYSYDANGNRTALRRPKQNEWTFDYDGANRLVAVTDALANGTSYVYDGNGNRTRVEDANGHPTSFEYDALNRLSAMVYADSAREEYEHDENGNRTRVLDAKSQVVSFEYDVLNRETLKRYESHAEPTGDDITSIATSYDGNGNPLSVGETYSGATGARLTAKTYDDYDRLTGVTDAWGKTIRYAYDANGNRTELRDPDGKITAYTFDALNRAETVTLSGVGVTQYSYYRNSLLRNVTYPNGALARHTYDLANRPRVIENLQSGGLVSRFEHEYDPNGNRTRQVETRGAVVETTTYDFDVLDRLVEVAYPDKTTTYTYDAAGNRLTEQTTDPSAAVVADRIFAYDERNRLTAIDDLLSPADSVAYDFDANGNQIRKTKGGIATELRYDIRDHLRTLTQGVSILGRYFYDYQGLRVGKEIPGVLALRYVYDDDSVLLQTDSVGNTLAKYDYGPDRLLSLSHAVEGRQFYLFDGLGSVSDLMRPDGALQASYKYDAWGASRGGIGASSNPFGFTGHERDETDLYYFKARFYDPEIGRFLSEDPAPGDFNNPPSLHKYLYAYANPTRFVDPSGMTTEQQFTDLIISATDRYLKRGNLTKLGEAGELVLERALTRAGYTIVKGPATMPGQHNADVIAFDPENGKFMFFDNKIQTGKETVSKADNLTKGQAKSIAVARQNVDKLRAAGEIPAGIYEQMKGELKRLQADPKLASWIISTETPEGVTNVAKQISVRLAKKGVRFADFSDDQLNIKGLEESLGGVRGAKKYVTQAGKALPAVGLAVSGILATQRVEAAVQDDDDYLTMMALLQAKPHFQNHSLMRELAVIAGEEGTSEVLAWVGGGVGTLCGPWCMAGGAVLGGIGGDYLGGYLAGREFDRQHGLTEEKLKEILEELK